MHTGYDSFWMYQNNRHEPVLNLPKNDNYSPAVLTDCCKQVQNGGRPNHMNCYMPTQNNIATSYPNGQHRTPGSQYIWSSSVYSQPLKPSYVSNFHPKESCSSESNNLGYQPPRYSQAQQSNLRYFKNPNTSVSQMSNSSNRQNNNGASVTRDNYSNNQTPRIRVKDLCALNNCTASSQVQNPALYQILQKKQHEPSPNYAAVNHNITCNSGPQSKFGNYGEGNLLQSDPTLHYRTAVREQHSQVSPNSNSFYLQNAQAQLQFGNGRQMQRNFNLQGSVEKYVPGKTLNGGNNQGPDIPNDKSESLLGCKSVKVIQKRNLVQINNPEVINNSGYANNRLINDSCNRNNLCQVQDQQMEIVETALYRSSKSAVTKADSDGSAHTDVRTSSFVSNNGQKNTVIKISIPHSGESTFLTISDCNSTSNASNLSLAALLESNDQPFCGWTQNTPNKNTRENLNVPAVQPVKTGFSSPTVPNVNHVSNTSPNSLQSNHNHESVHRQISTVPPRKRFCRVVEPFINVNKENVEEFLKTTSDFEVNLRNFGSKVNSGSSRKDENIVKETIFQNDITLNTLKLKQENFTPQEDPGTEQQIPESAVLLENIKTEGNRDEPEMEDYQTLSSEDRTNLEEPLASFVEVTENIEFTKADIEKFVFPSAPGEPTFVKDSEDSAEQEKNSSSENRVESQEKLSPPEGNYKSKINRDKLDMLIQFLEKDEEPSQIDLNPQTKTKRSCNNQGKKGIDLNHNRRKLSKTCVVKNKNNSREMISMVSHKTSRSELVKSPSETPHTMKPRSGSNTVEEIKADPAEETTKQQNDLICSDKPVAFKRASENPTQVKDNSTPKSKNELVTTYHQTCKEFSVEGNSDSQRQQNIVNIIQALQISESIFCKSCDLVSTLDSFWINVASGELRCLNCFKRMRLEIDANLSETNEAKVVQNDKTEKGSENIRENANALNDTSRCKWSSKHESAAMLTKNVTQKAEESMKSPKKENTTNFTSGYAKKETFGSPKSSRRHSLSSEERVRSLEEYSVKISTSKETASHKMKHVDDVSKPETKDAKFKKKDSVSKETCTAPKNTTSFTTKQVSDAGDKKERKHVEEHTKREKKGTEYSSQSKKGSDSKDFTSLKSSEEHLRDETKMNSSDKLVKRKESCNSNKVNTAEQSARKSTKCEQFEKTKTRSPSKESCTCHESKALEETKSSSTEESKAKLSSNNSEKQKKVESVGQAKKRKNLDHDIGAVKVRILEEHTKKDAKPVPHRTNVTDTLKQEISRHKFTNDTQNIKNPADKLKRNTLSKEEHSKKESKDSLAKDVFKGNKTHQKLKTHEQTKQKISDFSDVSRRKSKEEHEVKQSTETLDVQKRKSVSKEENEVRTHVQEISKRNLKHGNGITENKDKKKQEEREKNSSFGKIQKTINLDNREKVIPSSEQPRKSDTMYKALKENQNTEMRTSTTTENKKIRKDSHKDKREHKNNWEDRKDKRKIRGKETSEIDFREDVDGDKKKHSDLSEGMCDKSQTENKHLESSDKVSPETQKPALAVKGSQESVGSNQSAVLLAKLMRKTKKLSWSLLGEA